MKPEFDQQNAAICGVSFDSVADNHAFREKFHFDYPLLSDSDKQLAIACGAAADASAPHPQRVTVVIKPDGTVAKVYTEITDKEQHARDVLLDLS